MLYWILASSVIFTIMGRIAAKTTLIKGLGLLDISLTPITAICEQDFGFQDKSISLRIAKLSTFIVTGVIVPTFSAFVISHLTVDKIRIPFTDLETFLKDGTYQLASLYVFPISTSFFEVILRLNSFV